MVNKIQIISCHQSEFSYPVFMIVFSTNIFIIYRSNIYMPSTFWKAANKTVFIKRCPNWIKKLLVICQPKLVSIISFIVAVTQGSAIRFLFLPSLSLSCFAKSHSYYTVSISSTLPRTRKYVVLTSRPYSSLDTYSVKNNSSLTVFININKTVYTLKLHWMT